MAIHNLISNKILIDSTGKELERPIAEGTWQDASGLEVEDFISSRLQKAVSKLSFVNETSELISYNADGDELDRVTVINATPNYVPNIELVNLRINSNNNSLKVGEDIELNYPSISRVEAGIRLTVTYDILGKTYYSIDPQKVEFTLGNKTLPINRVIPNAASDPEAIHYIDITELFQDSIFNGTLSVSCATKDYSDSDSYEGTIFIRKIVISYTNKGYIEGNLMSFNVSGLNASEASKFRLLYYTDGSTDPHYADIDSGGSTASISLETGAHQIYARVEYRAGANLYYSNWVQTNVIIDCKNIQGNAVAVINSVPTEINNCSNALLYKICYAPGTNGGDIVINSYISEDYDKIADENKKKNYLLNSTTLSLMSGDEPNEKEFYSFFELETVSNSDARFMGFDINGQTVYSYEGSNPDINPYFFINIVENKYNIDGAFNHTPGAALNYSQINGSGSNVFVSDNTNVLPGDGWTVDGRYTAYQVSASDQELFNTPIDLTSSLHNGFTFEFLLKSYNVNGEEPFLTIGNLHVGPGYVRVHEDIEEGKEHASNSIHVNSKADFGKEEVTHILVTYSKQYKPTTYMDTYNQLLTQGTVNYSSPGAVTPYDVLKIYVNGVINREIQVSSESLKRNDMFKMQIAPTTSDVKFYGLRTYNFPFTYAQVQKNYISSILDANDKKIFYDKNDILDAAGHISLKKCINKYNVIVYAIPETDCPLYYGNKEVAGDEGSNTSVLVHYANPDWADYNVKMWGGKYKAQGSSAKKYLIHNCQYNIKRGKCLNEADFAHNMSNNLKEGDEGYIAPKNTYTMPGTDIAAKKFVGKVNYASSMQTHKQGACDLFDGAYKHLFQNSLDTKMPTEGRKAVIEKEFLYFYYNLKPGETLDTVTINDTLEDARFMGFQTWGPGKADDPTFGYGDNTPEYILMEGADNGNAGANFKVPWAALQTYDSTVANIGTQYINQQPASVTKNDFTTGLLIADETIKFTAADDPLDVDYGLEEYDPHYTDANLVFKFPDVIKETSLKKFVEFYNAMYQYDFSCFLSMGDIGIEDTFNVKDTYVSEKYPKGVTRYKLYCSASTIAVTGDSTITSAGRFDVFRWDPLREQWVPAGLHMKDDNTTWDTFNLVTKYLEYKESDLYAKYNQEMTDEARAKFHVSSISTPTHLTSYVFPAMKEMFIAACKEYVDIEDIAYHQAVIRVLSGTDNRAKNTYFQIIGKLYEEVDDLDAEGNPQYDDKGKKKTKWVRGEKGDYKIRLMQDDLDTIFATDNNGQQLKPYYLLEPSFNLDLEHMWGDQHSSFFYPFDLCFATQINEYTGKIINYLIGSNSDITSDATKLHEFFLRIQETLPAIAYNHTAEIYYELAQTLIQGGTKLYEDSFKNILPNYANNSVPDPLSLSHGSNYEGEIQFLRNRMLLLASLTSTAPKIQSAEQTFANIGTGDGSVMVTVSGNAKYLDYFYPNYRTSENLSLLLSEQNPDGKDGVNYDNLFANNSVFPNASDKIIVQSLAIPEKMYAFTFSGQKLTGVNLANIDKYDYLEITEGLQFLGTLPTLPRARFLQIDGDKTQYSINSIDVEVYKFLPVIEELHLTNTSFNNTTLDFRNCNRLRVLKLEGCSGITSIILPEGKSLKEVYLPSSLRSLSIINNPNLRVLDIPVETRFTSLTLNCNASGSVNISDLIAQHFDFANAKLLKLSGNCNLSTEVTENIAVLGSKCSLNGQYMIDGGNADISFQLKKNLVNTFGNIDSVTNNVYFIYKKSPLYQSNVVYDEELSGFKFVSNSDNIYYPFDSITFTQGNEINIVNGRLDIKYTSNIPSTVAVLDESTGELEVKANKNEYYNYEVIFNGTIKASGRIYIGKRDPLVGDLAYADGTFSPTYIKNKTLVGIVYAVRSNPSDVSKIDLAILSNNVITGVMAPEQYAYDVSKGEFAPTYGGGTTTSTDQSNVLKALRRLYDNSTLKPTADSLVTSNERSYSPYAVVYRESLPQAIDSNYQITKDYDLTSFPSALTDEKDGSWICKQYRDVANYHISRLMQIDSEFATFIRPFIDNATGSLRKSISIAEFDTICSKFHSGVVRIMGGASLSKGTYAQLLYPAYYKADLYSPTADNLLPLYSAGSWHIPSVDEMSLLIAHRITSTVTAYTTTDESKEDWYKDKPIFNGLGIFTDATKPYFSGFLQDLKYSSDNFAYVTCEAFGFKNVVYTKTSTSYNANSPAISWKAEYSNASYQYNTVYYQSESLSCRRDQEYTLPLCCQITIEKDE